MSRVLVIGLDGVPLHLIETWAQAGHMPTLRGLMQQGATGLLNSTVPHTSAPAWTSFMTGKNPGKTGIFDFLYRKQGTYTFFPHNTRTRSGKAVWDLVSEAGKTVGVINVPMTYPVRPVNGAFISGWMTPYMAKDYFYPSDLISKLEAAIGQRYQIYPFETFSERNPQAYFDACHSLLEMRTASIGFLMQHLEWDFLMAVFFDTDRILHQVWHYLDSGHPLRAADCLLDKSGPVTEYFAHLDRNIGKLIDQAGPGTNVVIMSDHGMGAAHNMIVLNNWLLKHQEIGLRAGLTTGVKRAMFDMGFTLRNLHTWVDRFNLAKHAEYKMLYSADRYLKKVFLSFDDVDWSRSRVYSYGRAVGPLFLNVRGREPQGIIASGSEYERVRREIAEEIRDMNDPQSGRKLVGRVLYPEDLYHGPHLDLAPDLILEPASEADVFYGLSDFGSNRVYEPFYRYSGMHRQHGTLILCGPDFKPGQRLEGAEIIDVSPTILRILGVPIPADMDGKPLAAAFRHLQPEPAAAVAGEEVAPAGPQDGGYTAEDQQAIEDQLRKLGYLG